MTVSALFRRRNTCSSPGRRGRRGRAGYAGRVAADLPFDTASWGRRVLALLVDYAAYGWRPRDDLALALYHLGDVAGSNEICRQILADPLLPPGERERIERNLRGA